MAAEQRELALEQQYVDRVHQRLDAAAAAARALAADGHARARVGNDGGLVERDAMVFQAARRLAALDAAADGLVFGRLDLTGGETRYVGRIGLRDADREVMLLDWRAPAAAAFYRATPQDPHDVVRRRVLRCRRSTVLSIDDELLDAAAAPDDLVVVGEGALIAELARARDATMHSVVATIQKEQDDAIRAPLRGVTAITGGPGTGKSVVALHRAAYLLYTDRHRFQTGGVLVVGPSDVFIRYIERVLPSLGETAVTLRAIGDVVDDVSAQTHDAPPVAAVKGSARMASLLRRVARAAVPGAPTRLRYFYRDDVLILDEGDLARLRQQLLATNRHNPARPRATAALLEALWEQVSGDRAVERGRVQFDDEVTGSPAFQDFLERWWPELDGVEVLGWLADRSLLSQHAAGLLDETEQALLATSWAEPQISVEDVPLVDELRHLLGDPVEEESDADPLLDLRDETVPEVTTADDRRTARPRSTGRVEEDRYAHILVDEAQDLSPMQWRMLGRRGRFASWTVVGDPAQSSWPLPAEAEAARAEALNGLEERTFRLSTNYRNSAEIFDLAAQVARTAVADPDLPEAVRRTGHRPEHRVASEPGLTDATRRALAELCAAVEGTVAVIAPDVRRAQVAAWLADVTDPRVRVLTPLESKGLEFDGVVVVSPGEIAAGGPTGLRTLYVVLTRATQRLLTVGVDDSWLP